MPRSEAPARPSTRGRVADARPALLLREQRRRRRRVRVAGVAVLVLLLVAGLAYLLGWSSVLSVSRVEVSGLVLLSEDEVLEAGGVPVGRPLARVDTEAVQAHVAALAPVREVEVRRAWPDAISIEVVERTPVLVVEVDDGLTLVDADGVSYATVPKLPAGVTADDVVAATVSAESNEERTELLADLATVVGSLPPELREQVEGIGADSTDTIELNLSEDRTLRWGSAEDSALKAEVALVLLENDGETYDVSVPSHPSVE